MNDQTNSTSKVKTIASLPVRTQFMVFTLFGDYLLEKEEKIWTSDLLYLMGLLDVSEKAVRSTLSRMTRKGWLAAEKNGRRSIYSLTDQGRALLLHGRNRIFEPTIKDWDGHWHMLVYSLPENLRSTRHTLRTQLSWLGFGSLAPGIWISPHNRGDELENLISELEITSCAEIFSSQHLGPSTPQTLVEQCWDLSSVSSQYEAFMNQFQAEYQGYNKNSDYSPSPEDAFIRRFWLTHSFQSFPLKDPNLPIELLPKNWIGIRARELFDSYHTLLGDKANQFVDGVLAESYQYENAKSNP